MDDLTSTDLTALKREHAFTLPFERRDHRVLAVVAEVERRRSSSVGEAHKHRWVLDASICSTMDEWRCQGCPGIYTEPRGLAIGPFGAEGGQRDAD